MSTKISIAYEEERWKKMKQNFKLQNLIQKNIEKNVFSKQFVST